MKYEKKEFIVKGGLKVVLRSPEENEAEEILTLIKRICGQTDYLLSSPEDISDDVQKEKDFIRNNNVSPGYFIVVYVDDKPVGDCSLNFDRHVKARHRCSVGIGIDEKYWNMGIGSLLFDEMIALAKGTAGIEQIGLELAGNNERGRNLYLKKGFKTVGAMPKALKLKDGTYVDLEMMVKEL